jgi:hypothetical protein
MGQARPLLAKARLCRMEQAQMRPLLWLQTTALAAVPHQADPVALAVLCLCILVPLLPHCKPRHAAAVPGTQHLQLLQRSCPACSCRTPVLRLLRGQALLLAPTAAAAAAAGTPAAVHQQQ